MWTLAAPPVPDSQRARGTVGMRYEDIAQDGSLKVGGMPHAIGMVCFRELWQHTQINRETRPLGIVPILSRLVMQGTGRPISIRNQVEVEASYEIGHVRDAAGEVARIYVNMYAELYGPAGRTHDPQPTNLGARVHVGRVVGEHVFTRPFGRPEERKVRSLPLSTGDYVPPEALAVRAAESSLVVPSDVQFLDEAFTADIAPLVFGITHTDSNQHVNSLVYPQLFEDAALRRLFDHGRDVSTLLVDHIDIAFKKPCFSGERLFLVLRAFEHHGKLGAIGYLAERDAPVTKARCLCTLTFGIRA